MRWKERSKIKTLSSQRISSKKNAIFLNLLFSILKMRNRSRLPGHLCILYPNQAFMILGFLSRRIWTGSSNFKILWGFTYTSGCPHSQMKATGKGSEELLSTTTLFTRLSLYTLLYLIQTLKYLLSLMVFLNSWLKILLQALSCQKFQNT